MNRIAGFLGRVCDGCKLCQYARKNPETLVGKIMNWHGKWCPAWKARIEIEKERSVDQKPGSPE